MRKWIAGIVTATALIGTGVIIGHVTARTTVTIVCTQQVIKGQSYLNDCFYR
jgi:hypothetical protein